MSEAAIPKLIESTQMRWVYRLLTVAVGISLMAILAQIQIPLPWTPVPITGQTLGAAFIGLTCGGALATSVLGGYFALGWLGLPVFAAGASGFFFGPTLGYLVGMWAAATVIGFLADRGWTSSWWRALGASYAGSAIVFTCGLAGLSLFVPKETLLEQGLYPFLLGDLIKNILAASSVRGLSLAAK